LSAATCRVVKSESLGRELRHQRLIEQIASHDGLSYRRSLQALPLLLLVLAEHPHTLRSLSRKIARGRRALGPFG